MKSGNDMNSGKIHYFNNIQEILFNLKNSNKKTYLFLDIDGTLSDFQTDPAQCFIPKKTLHLLKQIIACSIPVSVVTGRDLSSAQKLVEYIEMPIAALHGLEIYLNQESILLENKNNIDFSAIYQHLSMACIDYPKLLIEHKKSSIALHYRNCPELAQTAKKIMQDIQRNFPSLKLMTGKYVFELISPHANKGEAIKQILNHINKNNNFSAIFIGDDITDEDGFSFINQLQNSITIKVGEGISQAKYRLKDTREVAHFLEEFLKHIHINHLNTPDILSGEKICLN